MPRSGGQRSRSSSRRSSTPTSSPASPSGCAIRSARWSSPCRSSLDDGELARLPGYRVQHSTRARADEGRHPLRPARLARRVRGARDVDDVEVRAPATAVRRREGRRALQSARAVRRRARAADAPLHAPSCVRVIGPQERHSRAGHGDERADDGVDDGHVLDAAGPRRAGDRDGQADRASAARCSGTRRPAPAS